YFAGAGRAFVMIHRLAGPLLSEHIDLIREIGRNLLGEAIQRNVPPVPGSLIQTVSADLRDSAALPGQEGLPPDEHPIDRWTERHGTQLLLGLRQPNAVPGSGLLATAAARFTAGADGAA